MTGEKEKEKEEWSFDSFSLLFLRRVKGTEENEIKPRKKVKEMKFFHGKFV